MQRRGLASVNITRPQTPVTAGALPQNRDRREAGAMMLSVAVVCNVTGGRKEMADETARNTAGLRKEVTRCRRGAPPGSNEQRCCSTHSAVTIGLGYRSLVWPATALRGRLVRGCVAASRRRHTSGAEWRQQMRSRCLEHGQTAQTYAPLLRISMRVRSNQPDG